MFTNHKNFIFIAGETRVWVLFLFFVFALNTICMGFLVALITHRIELFVALKHEFVICEHFTDQSFKTTEFT